VTYLEKILAFYVAAPLVVWTVASLLAAAPLGRLLKGRTPWN
jgi:hypothetical protein